ncbi:hypothetical protein AAKU64_003919 [Undibacterium sp. GrIS 1.8]|uniref:hypothetical protein n=1 Tax=unclassified Undibacterium TaxID=2630295 RepID=UPI0033965D45
MKTTRPITHRHTRRNGFKPSALLQNLLQKAHAAKLKILPPSLMLGLSATAMQAQADIRLSFI